MNHGGDILIELEEEEKRPKTVCIERRDDCFKHD